MNQSTIPQRRAPIALVVDDTPIHALATKDALSDVGFEVIVCSNLAQATLQARQLLDPQQPCPRVLIIADCKGVQPFRPEIEGSNWVAVLAQEMQAGHLHPATIVAISSDPNEQRLVEARTAGCIDLLDKPLTDEKALWLRSLMLQPATIPHEAADPQLLPAIAAFQSCSVRLLQTMTPVPSRVTLWSSRDAHLILAHLTAFEIQETAQVIEPSERNVQRVIELLAATGGHEAARALLLTCSDTLASHPRKPPYGQVLKLLLEGKQKTEILDMHDELGYSRKHLYECFRDLPDEVAKWFNQHLAEPITH